MISASLAPVKRRLLVLAGICLILAGALVYRFYIVQIVRHGELKAEAGRRYTIENDKKMKQRGKILDANGHLLVGNLPKTYVVCSPYSVVVEPFAHLEKSLKPGVRENIPKYQDTRRRKVARLLAEYFGGSEELFYLELDPWRERCKADGSTERVKRQNYVIDSAADPEQVRKFKAAMKAEKLSLGGIRFEDIYVRNYPKGRMLANVIGLANVGKGVQAEQGGLEKSIGEDLRAEDRVTTYQKSGSGEQLSYGLNRVDVKGHDGDDIYLTIQEPIQAILEEELDAVVKERNPKFVYAVIVDPRTGNILAMSQRPNFDPGDPSTILDGHFPNALAGNSYEPGSVMKPFTFAKALDEGIIDENTIIDCGEYSTWVYRNSTKTDPRGYGKMTPAGVLKKSSNIGTAKLSLVMGEKMVYDMLKTFRFGQKSGLPFAAESRGRLPRYPFPDRVMFTTVVIGYSVQMTILQLARGYCALANGGFMPELRLLDRRRSSETGEIIPYPAPEPEQIFKNPDTAAKITEMLISVTDRDGTGKEARIPGFVVAGKTGTSKMIHKGKYINVYRASFCGYVPARNPEFVMVVTVEGLTGKAYGGGAVAAPIFQRTMNRVLKIKNIPPDNPEELKKRRK